VPHAGEFVIFDRIHPSHSAIYGAGELSTVVVVSIGAPALILEPVPGAVGVIDGEPLFITTIRWSDTRP
jgi:acetylornithine/succinyldiaminopimelate/putrescine aminotransferase